MSFFKKKRWLIFLLILVAVVIAAALSARGNNPVANGINFVFTPVQSGITKVSDSVKTFFHNISNVNEIQKENEQLHADNAELEAKIKDVSEYIEENERLKRLLGISEEFTDYKTVAARVVGYEPDNWFSYVTIDKGENEGIKVSDTVITADGLLGQVAQVGYNWAKVSTIINAESSAGVRITRNGEIGIVEGDTKLSKTNKCKLKYLMANASVNAGDILETSGLGGIYPPGLMVGKIESVKKDNMGHLDYALINPFVDFNNLYEVLVITDWTFEDGFYDIPEEENYTPVNNIEDESAAITQVVG